MPLVIWLLRRDTRRARWLILRLRIRTLRYGDDFAETYLAALATIYGVVLLLPGDTTSQAKAWEVLVRLLYGDVGIGVMFAVLAVPLWLSALRLIPCLVQRVTLVACFSVWVGMSVGFFLGFPLSLGPWLAILNAAAAWVTYLRTDMDIP